MPGSAMFEATTNDEAITQKPRGSTQDSNRRLTASNRQYKPETEKRTKLTGLCRIPAKRLNLLACLSWNSRR